MSINFRSDMLETAINDYGLVLPDDIKWDNERMIKALGNYFMTLTPERYSWNARYVQSLSTPMLCRHLKEEVKNFKSVPLPAESDAYIAEKKMNGFRCIACYSPETGFEFFSRRESSLDYLNGNFTDKFLFINNGLISEPSDYKGKFNYRFVIDGELLINSSENDLNTMDVSIEDYIQGVLGSGASRARAFQKDGHRLEMTVFDVLYFEKNPAIPAEWTPMYEFRERGLTPDAIQWVEQHYSKYLTSAGFALGSGKAKKLYQFLFSLKDTYKYDLRKYPFYKRRELRKIIVDFLRKNNLPFVEVPSEDVFKTAFTDTILREGGEGSILKNKYAPYISGMRSCRSHRAALKVKQSIENMLDSDGSLMEDFDVFITGANPPKSDRITDMIGSLSCSVYIRDDDGNIREHEIANVSGISHDWKRRLAWTNPETGKIGLNPEYKDKVISINGLALTSTNLKFQHATLKDKGRIEFKAKNPTECTWDEATLKEMTLIRGK